MRASRLVATLLLLQTRGRMTAEALAAELEVSVRTIYRDIEALGAAGVPVYGNPGRDGGYTLVDGYRTRLTGLAAPEAESLFLLGVPAAAAGLGYGEALAAAQLKLLASLPAGQRAHAERMAERFHLDAPPWYHDADTPDLLADIAAAVWDRRRLTIGYERWARPRRVTVTLNPLGLVLKAGQWYLVGQAGDPVRIYRVSRIGSVSALDETFEPPDGFDLAAWWRAHLADFEARRYSGTATLRMSPQVFADLPHLLEPALARAAAASAQSPDAVGWIQVQIPMESVPYTAGLILQLGPEVEALGPPALRARIRADVQELAQRYA